jgi:asparagine synthase (glutamine-hydrolysing)
MPGICAIASQLAPADTSLDLAEMLGRTRHHPWYREDRFSDSGGGISLGRMSLGFVNAAAQPAFNEDRGLVAVMAGELLDAEEQRRELTTAGHRFSGDSHAEILVHGYEERGPSFFASLRGAFAAAIWDAQRRRLVLVNDRFGLKPLYYVKLAGRLLAASEIKSLLADPEVPRQENVRGVAQFFTFGQLLGEDTLLEAVRLLPAAGCLTYDANEDRLTMDRYRRLGTGTLLALSGPELLDRVDEVFGRAVVRCAQGTDRLGLSLSGGLDSRTILAALPPDRPLTASVSVGIAGSVDHDSAARMAALANCPHHSHLLDPRFLTRFEQHLRQMVHLTDGHYLSQCIVMPTLPVYRELGIDVLLRGHAGELMHMDKAYNFSLDREGLRLRTEAELEEWLSRHLRTYMLDGTGGPLFAPVLQDQAEVLARDSLRSCLAESAGVEPPLQRVWHLFVSQRLRRETALSLVKFGSLVETRLPYLDNDLVDLLLATPPETKLSDHLQAHILRRRRPAFLNVVNANTGTRLGAGRVARLFARARLKVLGKLGVRGYQPYERLGLWLREELRPLVERLLLSERCLGRGVFDPDTLRGVVRRHLAGRRNHTFLILALLIFEQGQREFRDGEVPAEDTHDPRTVSV